MTGVLVEAAANPLQTMAAYIDLNLVRSGLVEDPKDYPYSGYEGAIFGSEAYVQRYQDEWKQVRSRKHAAKVHRLTGADWGDLAVLLRSRTCAFLALK